MFDETSEQLLGLGIFVSFVIGWIIFRRPPPPDCPRPDRYRKWPKFGGNSMPHCFFESSSWFAARIFPGDLLRWRDKDRSIIGFDMEQDGTFSRVLGDEAWRSIVSHAQGVAGLGMCWLWRLGRRRKVIQGPAAAPPLSPSRCAGGASASACPPP